MRSRIIVLALAAVACVSTPPGTPEEVAAGVIDELDAGRPAEAGELFARIASDAEAREKIYPILFFEARDRYRLGDAAGAAEVLRFMAPRYPAGAAVREALLYSLFLERAQSETADAALVDEIGDVLADMGEGEVVPEWVDLVRSQQAIDRGELSVARDALAQFLDSWEGNPPELMLYVEDLERYLRTH